MHALTPRALTGWLLTIALLVCGGVAIGCSWQRATSTPASSSVPHCLSDDYNDGTQALCYTTRVTDNATVYIDATDNVVHTSYVTRTPCLPGVDCHQED